MFLMIVPPLLVAIEGDGEIALRRATFGDSSFVAELLRKEAGARAFAEAVIRHQWLSENPGNEATARLTDTDLTTLLRKWAVDGFSLPSEDLVDLPSIRENLRQELKRRDKEFRTVLAPIQRAGEVGLSLPHPAIHNFAAYIFDEMRRLEESAQRIVDLVHPHLTNVAAQISQHLREMEALRTTFIAPCDVSQIFGSLPTPEQWRETFAELDEGKNRLDDLGYGFSIAQWSVPFIRLTGRGQYGRRELHDAIREYTRSPEFTAKLQNLFDGSPRLSRRWRVVGPALSAHLRREYVLSIPALLAQLEGVITDLLILKGQATFRGKDLLAKEAGRIKLKGKSAKPDVLTGLKAKLRHSGYQSIEEVRDAAEFILNGLVRQRNAILHGSRTSYASAKLSVQLLLLLWIYAEVFAAAESGEIT